MYTFEYTGEKCLESAAISRNTAINEMSSEGAQALYERVKVTRTMFGGRPKWMEGMPPSLSFGHGLHGQDKSQVQNVPKGCVVSLSVLCKTALTRI